MLLECDKHFLGLYKVYPLPLKEETKHFPIDQYDSLLHTKGCEEV